MTKKKKERVKELKSLNLSIKIKSIINNIIYSCGVRK